MEQPTLLKFCSSCQVLKSVEQFGPNVKRKDHLQPWCRSCQNKNSRAYYAKNKIKHRKVVVQNKKRLTREKQSWVRDYKATRGCIVCGEKDWRVLDLDHVRGIKVGCVANLVARNVGWAKIYKEVEKCDVRCANCHRRITYLRGVNAA